MKVISASRRTDIGAYDTCPHGRLYCYANTIPQVALENHEMHDPIADILGEDSSVVAGRSKDLTLELPF